ncbi:MAG: 3-phosphoserine/phosphohydroxythreonine transaminase [Flavobacteriaceae bacterium]|nr:3-phosphoserine/phosphohydroxythreonine transaminase [Flavobacteriaceae bacterium]|tara:strand:+ start:5162 stop:6226 length:1065 start_codon:yes stop_codon:yes gene_type:complete
MKKHNFNAGPSILPNEVIKDSSKAILELDNIGLSLLEISHRSKEFASIMERACDKVLKLANLQGKGYKALFIQGGASQQFIMAAYNLLENKAGYINTGSWSSKAMKEASLLGNVIEIASSKDQNFNYIPKKYTIPNDCDYLHITTNNTIFGTQYKTFPSTSVPLIADMSSDIFSKNIDYSEFDLFYAGAQKNIGPAGVTLVVLKEQILNKVSRSIPSILDYSIHIKSDSMFNTPPVFSVYTTLLNLIWIENQGGIENLETNNNSKANLIYNEIDRNSCFKGFANKEDRSIMNATFSLIDDNLTEKFNELCNMENITGIKGHRSVGGYRASIYNALPIASVRVLVDCMQKLENNL